ncbi:hypothetical protein AAFF_G00194240 [Aldrovandia affinis]|uniref:Inactive dual specificity phosphatase 27 n=1 Tax=Aldrovandia affinis TaxID=143900 RepID=A0AAD7WVG9_9TELE|nr:hypothetical protein AAFF_G00194240 [Aldrovandia affinis]
MASRGNNNDDTDQMVPEDKSTDVKSIQSHYLRCPSPSRFSVISDTDTESIFMEPIHLSSAVAARKIINEELKPRVVRVDPVPESMLESAEQLMVEDLYNRVKDMMDDTSSYNTPCVLDIQRAMVHDRLGAPFNPVDEVWPNIFIAEKTVAVNKSRLKRMGITHILNAAHGTGVYTGIDFYEDMNIQYQGIEVDDFPYADISPHFRTAAEFLDEALLTHKGKVLVNSVMGISRSVILVASYLMIFHHMTIMEALQTLRKKRPICPNEGFLKQLRQLNEALLQERDGDDHSDTLSQCSVIETHTHQEGEESILGAKAHSIFVEEEDGESEMSSVPPITQRYALTEQNKQREDQAPTLPNEQKVDDDTERMIHEWQQRNEKYQSEDWWQAQLMSEDEESFLGRSCHLPEDLESVSSVDIQALKEQVWARGTGHHPRSGSISTEDSSYADRRKQRLREIEKQAANQYWDRGQGEGNKTGGKDKQEDEESALLSETSSLYSFCMKNKDTLTPLERWRVKRIQFGWNKKDIETKTKTNSNNGQENGEGENIKVPALEDVDLTAYQTWKLKQQKKLGAEKKNEIIELCRGQDSASAKKKQHREEILEHSQRTLGESQSMCSWGTESSLSGGSAPLCTVWPNMPDRSAGDDATSMVSMQSGHSSLSQVHSIQGQPLVPPLIPFQTAPQVPIVPLPNTQGPGSEVASLANIQNWISNVVTETVMQKQGELMAVGGNIPPAQANFVLSLGALSVGGRTLDDDKASILSGASNSRFLCQSKPESVLSAGLPRKGSHRGKITDTSVPLYSLFQDQVNLHKLDTMDKEIKSEMRSKMLTYEIQKIATDNKRSTLFKKKKPKEESDEDDEANKVGMTKTVSKYNLAPVHERLDKHSGLTWRPSSSSVERKKTSSNTDRWFSDIKTPSKYPESYRAESAKPWTSRTSSFGEQTTESSDFSIRRRESSLAMEQEHGRTSRFYPRAVEESSSSSQMEADGMNIESHIDPCSERPYHSKLRPAEDHLSNSLMESKSCRMRRSYTTELEEQEEEEEEEDYAVKRKFTHYSGYENGNTDINRGGEAEREKREEVPSYINRHRLRSRAQADEDLCDDIVTTCRT